MNHPCPLINLIKDNYIAKYVKLPICTNDIICLSREQREKWSLDTQRRNIYFHQDTGYIFSNNNIVMGIILNDKFEYF